MLLLGDWLPAGCLPGSDSLSRALLAIDGEQEPSKTAYSWRFQLTLANRQLHLFYLIEFLFSHVKCVAPSVLTQPPGVKCVLFF